MINKITLIGRVGGDPDVKRLDNGAVVGKFSLATSEKWKDRDGELKEQTEWHNIVVWRELAEIAEKYIKKGNLVYIEGKVTYRKYTAQDGVEKSVTDIVASNMRSLTPKSEGQSQQQTPAQQATAAADAVFAGATPPSYPGNIPQGAQPVTAPMPTMDDLPF